MNLRHMTSERDQKNIASRLCYYVLCPRPHCVPVARVNYVQSSSYVIDSVLLVCLGGTPCICLVYELFFSFVLTEWCSFISSVASVEVCGRGILSLSGVTPPVLVHNSNWSLLRPHYSLLVIQLQHKNGHAGRYRFRVCTCCHSWRLDHVGYDFVYS